jgi:hypothetical protein
VTLARTLMRLATREYGPWAGLALLWLSAFLALGPRTFFMLATAALLVMAARTATLPNHGGAMRRRRLALPEMRAQAVAFLKRADLAALAGAAALATSFVLYLDATGHEEAARYAAVIALGLPPRFLLWRASAVAPGRAVFRVVAPWGGALLMSASFFLEPSGLVAAAALALREWLGLVAVLILLPRRPAGRGEKPAEPLGLAELAELSGALAGRRLQHLLGKAALGLLMGPFGTVAMRTLRGVGVSRRLSHRYRPPAPALLALGLVAAAGGLGAMALWRQPEVAAAGAYVVRAGATALSLLFWVALSGGRVATDSTDDDDD